MTAGITPAVPFTAGGPGALASEDAARMIAAAADIALVLDAEGTITDIAFGDAETARAGLGDWRGTPFIDTVTPETRGKAAELLAGGQLRWRQLNHAVGEAADVPIRYLVAGAGKNRRVALGRDLRPLAELQRRLIGAQQEVERDFLKVRDAQARARALFEGAAEPIIIADQERRRVSDLNPEAARLFGRRAIGGQVAQLFAEEDRENVSAMLGAAAASGEAGPLKARVGSGTHAEISARAFRQERTGYLALRLSGASAALGGSRRGALAAALSNLPDAIVVTDPSLIVLDHNPAFADLVQLSGQDGGRGHSLDQWLGREGIDASLLLGQLRKDQRLAAFPTIIRPASGGAIENVEVAAAAALDADPPCIGFSIRRTAPRPAPVKTTPVTRSVEQLTELVGRVPLREIVRESTDLIERLCIEAALQFTRDNRASAAEILGLSRQGLYSKLHRHGMLDPSEAE